jgi:hypothetical protein
MATAIAIVEYDMASATQTVTAAWKAYQKSGEPLGLKFGEEFYDWRKKFKSKGGNGTKGRGLIQLLDELNIPRSTAYYWSERYEISIGLKEEKEHSSINGDSEDWNEVVTAEWEEERPAREAKEAAERSAALVVWSATYRAEYAKRKEAGDDDWDAAHAAEAAAKAAAPATNDWVAMPEVRESAEEAFRATRADAEDAVDETEVEAEDPEPTPKRTKPTKAQAEYAKTIHRLKKLFPKGKAWAVDVEKTNSGNYYVTFGGYSEDQVKQLSEVIAAGLKKLKW